MGKDQEINSIKPVYINIDGEPVCLTCQNSAELNRMLEEENLSEKDQETIRQVLNDRQEFFNNW